MTVEGGEMITWAEVKEILAIIDASDFREVHIEVNGLKIMAISNSESHRPSDINHEGQLSSTLDMTSRSEKQIQERRNENVNNERAQNDEVPSIGECEGKVIVRAPTVGHFFRASAPGKEPYIQIGDYVTAQTTIGLIEIMKTFVSVHAGTEGTIHSIFVHDGSSVGFDQPLLSISSAHPGR